MYQSEVANRLRDAERMVDGITLPTDVSDHVALVNMYRSAFTRVQTVFRWTADTVLRGDGAINVFTTDCRAQLTANTFCQSTLMSMSLRSGVASITRSFCALYYLEELKSPMPVKRVDANGERKHVRDATSAFYFTCGTTSYAPMSHQRVMAADSVTKCDRPVLVFPSDQRAQAAVSAQQASAGLKDAAARHCGRRRSVRRILRILLLPEGRYDD